MKMEKTPRYTQRERNMVLGFAAQYKDVIENKRTDAESNRKKDEVWRQIAKEFNIRVYHQRSSKQLRQLYKNMKLLLKKDLCGGTGSTVGGGGGGGSVSGGGGGGGGGDSKGNRSFMDILNALSQQDSVAQYISEQMSPSGYSSSRQQKFDDDFDDSKLPSIPYDGLDNDVIVIKSEDISDNEQSSQNGAGDMDDDDDDCLSTKDIPEVCLEEEDDEIFATDLRQPTTAMSQQQQHQSLLQQTAQQQQPEITIQNVGGIRVGSIGNIASLANAAAKSLQNGNNNNSICNNNNSALSISLTTTSNSRAATISAEQQQREQQQQLLFSGLGLSAVHAHTNSQQQLPTLQHATQRASTNNNNNNSSNSNHNHILNNGLLAAITNSSNYQQHNKHGHSMMSSSHHGNSNNHHSSNNNNSHQHHNHNNNSSSNNNNMSSSGNSNNRSNDYLLSLAIEERKRKIELLNAQIDYWKTLTKKLDANTGHNPTPSCLCHFPAAKLNGLQAPQNSS